jgi:Glycosyltransferase family 87
VRRPVAAALALLVVGWAAILWVPPFDDDSVNDLYVYRTFAAPVLDGELPYRDQFFEYPPLAAPAVVVPGLVGTGEETFRWAYAGWTLLLAAAVVLLCGALAGRTGGDRRRALLAAAAMPLLCGAMLRTHFDLAPVALMLLALLLVVAERPRLGLAVLGLAVMTKGFPIVAAPVVLAWLAAREGRRVALESGLVLAAVIGAITLASLAVSAQGTMDALTYQVDRPVQIESTPAVILYSLDGLGLGEAVRLGSHRADNVVHPADDPIAGALVAVLLGVMVLLSFQASARPGDRQAVVLASLGAVAAFACFGRVLSPQYLVWTVPLGALALAWGYDRIAVAVALATALTFVEFPSLYENLAGREPLPVAIVCLRDAALIAAVALTVRALELRGAEQLLDRRRPPVAVRLD